MTISILPKVAALAMGMSWSSALAAEETGIAWRSFDAATLAKAREEKKLVFLDVEAVWCHWCHVMDAKTYSEPAVQAALKEGFISAKLDSDSRPDLARRYEEYGWPALVIFDPVTLQDRAIGSGFQTKEEFLALLEKGRTKTDGDIQKSVKPSAQGALDAGQKTSLLAKLRDHYDPSATGWGNGSKFVPWGNIEYCIRLDQTGDGPARKMAEDTLAAATGLIDPVWGGVYQYSTDGDWVHPHFEKIMEYQAEISRAYALAYQAWKRPEDLKAAEDIARFLNDFLRSPEGAYYVSQDADVVPGKHSADYFKLGDAGRRALGMPRIDRHLYSRENGMAISALVALYQASGRSNYLHNAETAAHWIITNRSLVGGGFSHGAQDYQGPFLADQIYMGRAMLALYQVTADKQWLDRSAACADFCIKNFRRDDATGAGFLSGRIFDDAPPPVADQEENTRAVRWLNLLGKTTHEDRFSKAAEHAMRYLATHEVIAEIYSFTGGLLLADDELATEPVHIAIVGKTDDPAARALFNAAQKQPSSYKIIEWVTPGAPDSIFLETDKPAAYLCTGNRCSTPKFEAEELVNSFLKE